MEASDWSVPCFRVKIKKFNKNDYLHFVPDIVGKLMLPLQQEVFLP